MKTELITASAYSPKFKTYLFGAYVLERDHSGLPSRDTFKTLCTYTIDEEKTVARKEAIERVFKDNVRHDRGMIERHVGRVSLERLKAFAF